ncbi:MAG: energy transducer TonB, partial [Myxococcales bacterium]|nr:energy transducer TonB [Myxococcales bacterium]
IQNFPGIARAPFGVGLLVIRGAAPADSNTYLGYHRIPQLFHFGAISSVFNSDILAQIDYIPGNFDSRYGDAIGGVINVAPRKGRRDGFHGYVDADVFDIGALLEGPVGKGSWAVSARRSYIDALLPAVVPEDAGLGLVQAPRYWDYQGLFDYPLGGGEFSVRVFGSDDGVELVTQSANDEEVDERNQAGTGIAFHRADLVYRKQDGPWEFLITPSYRYQVADGNFGNLFNFALTNHDLSFRAEMTRWLTRRASIRVGTETIIGSYDVAASAPSFPAGGGLGSTDITNLANFNGVYVYPALYLTATIGLGERFTLLPGARAQYFGLTFNKTAVDPRLRFSWQVAERTSIKGGVGMFTQSPEITQFAPVWGNPELGLERSVHTSVGVAQELPFAMSLEVTGFYKHVWDRIESSSALLRDDDTGFRIENWQNRGYGQIFGMELLFRKNLTDRLFGWVSYTLSKSLEQPDPGGPYRNFSFDQPHILTLLGVYKLPRDWQIGARFRLVSGNPFTPVTDGVYDAEDGGYLPLLGATNSGRLPAFHQLDIRVDKRWILRRAMFNLYLDIQNIYNRQNVEAWNYNFDFTQRAATSGLPIIPSLGLRISW